MVGTGDDLGLVVGLSMTSAGDRAYFAVPLVKPAATYGVTVISFDVVSEGGERAGGLRASHPLTPRGARHRPGF